MEDNVVPVATHQAVLCWPKNVKIKKTRMTS